MNSESFVTFIGSTQNTDINSSEMDNFVVQCWFNCTFVFNIKRLSVQNVIGRFKSNHISNKKEPFLI